MAGLYSESSLQRILLPSFTPGQRSKSQVPILLLVFPLNNVIFHQRYKVPPVNQGSLNDLLIILLEKKKHLF